MVAEAPAPPGPAPSGHSGGRARSAAIVLTALALVCVHWWPVLGGDEGLYVRDLLLYVAPLKHYWAERVGAGELPLWAPYLAAGMPYLADPANQTLYPPNLIFLMPAPSIFRSVDYFLLAHALIAPLAVFLLARRLGISVLAAAYAGAAFALSGYVLSVADNINYLPAAVWVPALIAAMLAADRRAIWGPPLAAAALSLAMLILAGDPIDGLIAVGTGVLLTAARARSAGAVVSSGVLGLAVCALGAGVAAVQILPTRELLAVSVRGDGLGLADAAALSFPLRRTIELVQPYFFGSLGYGEDRFVRALYPGQDTTWAKSVYLGLIPLALALTAAVRRPRQTLPWLGLAAVTLVLAAGHHTPVFTLVWDLVPGANAFRYPEKMMFWVTLALCMAAALGLDALRGESPGLGSHRRPVPGRLWVYLALGAGLFAVLALELPSRAWLGEHRTELSHYWTSRLGHEASHLQGMAIHLLALFAAAGLVLALARRWPVLLPGLALLSLVDLLLVHRGLPPTSGIDWVREVERAGLELRATRERLGLGDVRVYYDELVTDDLLHEDVAAALSTPDALARGPGTVSWEILSTMRVRHHRPLIGALTGVRYLNGSWSALRGRAHHLVESRDLAQAPHATLAATNTGLVITPLEPRNGLWYRDGFRVVHTDEHENHRVLEVQGVHPRAHWVEDPHAGGIAIRSTAPERVVLDVRVPSATPATLTVLESAFPGWRARVDGRPVALSEDSHFLSLTVPPGEHTVELRYTATARLVAGAWLSGLGVLLVLGASLRRGKGTNPTRLPRTGAGDARAAAPASRS